VPPVVQVNGVQYRVQFSLQRKTIVVTGFYLLLQMWWINWYMR